MHLLLALCLFLSSPAEKDSTHIRFQQLNILDSAVYDATMRMSDYKPYSDTSYYIIDAWHSENAIELCFSRISREYDTYEGWVSFIKDHHKDITAYYVIYKCIVFVYGYPPAQLFGRTNSSREFNFINQAAPGMYDESEIHFSTFKYANGWFLGRNGGLMGYYYIVSYR